MEGTDKGRNEKEKREGHFGTGEQQGKAKNFNYSYLNNTQNFLKEKNTRGRKCMNSLLKLH